MNEDDSQGGGDEPSTVPDFDVVSLADVVDMHRNTGVGADAVLLHQRDQFTLGEIIGSRSVSFVDLHIFDVELLVVDECRQRIVVGHAFPGHHRGEAGLEHVLAGQREGLRGHFEEDGRLLVETIGTDLKRDVEQEWQGDLRPTVAMKCRQT